MERGLRFGASMPRMATRWPRGRRWAAPSTRPGRRFVALRKASEIGPPETRTVRGHELTLELPPMGLAVIEIRCTSIDAAESCSRHALPLTVLT